MMDVLKHGVLSLDIDIIPEEFILVPLEIFTSKTLVELKLAEAFDAMIPEDVSLPSLKTLFLSSIWFYNTQYCVLGKLLSACPLLEELTIRGETWQNRKCCRTVSSSTLKKLTILTDRFDYWDITLDTPSLAYLEYSDLVPNHYPIVNLESLVEAKLDIGLGYGNPSKLIKELRNVEVLELSSGDACQTFCHFREAIPVFSNLYRLSITINSLCNDWELELLPILLQKSPNLHTLIFKGPLYADKYEREYGLSCPVKVLKITEYGGKFGELEQMKRFLVKLSCLELVKVRAYAINDKEKSRITKDLIMVPRSSKCNIRIKFCEITK